MAAFSFELVSPEKLLFSGEVDAVVVPGVEGEFTVLRDHAPFLTTLKPGVIEIDVGSKKEKLFVRGGFADVSPSVFTVLAEQAIPLADLTAATLDADIEAAETVLKAAVGNDSQRVALEKRDQLRELKAALKL
jgi:F-type H+-transporting ATPase subunit epsilon